MQNVYQILNLIEFQWHFLNTEVELDLKTGKLKKANSIWQLSKYYKILKIAISLWNKNPET